MIPVPITQILTRTRFRDYWAVEFGADILRINYDYGLGTTAYSYSWTEVVPVVGMMWQVWFNDSFAAYPKIELGYAFGWYSDKQDHHRPVGRKSLLPQRHRGDPLQGGRRPHPPRRGRQHRRQGRHLLAVLGVFLAPQHA